MTRKNLFLLVLINCFLGLTSSAQTNYVGFIFVDTVEIPDPLIISFAGNEEANSMHFQDVLISKRNLDSLNVTQSKSFPNFLFSEGFLFYTAWEFRCLLEKYLDSQGNVQNPLFYNQLVHKINKAVKDTVWVYFDKENDKPKTYKGWEYYEIYPRKFLYFLVNGRFLSKCRFSHGVTIDGMGNIYFPVLVPLTW